MGAVHQVQLNHISPLNPQTEEVSIISAHEPWNEYLLENGKVLRSKHVATRALKLIGVIDDMGQQAYMMVHNTIVVGHADAQEPKGTAGDPTEG